MANTKPRTKYPKNITLTDEERRMLWALGVLFSDTETGILMRGMHLIAEGLSSDDRDKLNRLMAIREETKVRG